VKVVEGFFIERNAPLKTYPVILKESINIFLELAMSEENDYVSRLHVDMIMKALN
jgi:hypothetical protein